jgi:hypothetical protein
VKTIEIKDQNAKIIKLLRELHKKHINENSLLGYFKIPKNQNYIKSKITNSLKFNLKVM